MIILLHYRYRTAPASNHPGGSTWYAFFFFFALLSALVFQLQLKGKDQHFPQLSIGWQNLPWFLFIESIIFFPLPPVPCWPGVLCTDWTSNLEYEHYFFVAPAELLFTGGNVLSVISFDLWEPSHLGIVISVCLSSC